MFRKVYHISFSFCPGTAEVERIRDKYERLTLSTVRPRLRKHFKKIFLHPLKCPVKSKLSAAGVLLSVLLTVKTFKDARVFWSRYSCTNSLYGSPGYFVQQSKVSGSKKIIKQNANQCKGTRMSKSERKTLWL